ncbi:MAG: hypothetical protein ACSW8I_00010 [bacterium]
MANISITFTTLILLTFGAGGVSLAKCACSGKTSLLTMNDFGCCPSEGDCMTVTTVQLSDSDLPVHVDAPQLIAVAMEAPEWTPAVKATVLCQPGIRLSEGCPPPCLSLTTVLRV